MNRADLHERRVFKVSQFGKIECSSSSKGNLIKYSDGSRWIKANHFGYESLVEVISSRVALSLGLCTVKYDPCFLDTEKEFSELKPACVSESFISTGYTEITLGRLLQQLGSFKSSAEMYEAFDKNERPSDKVAWITTMLNPVVSCRYYIKSLAKLIWFDSLVYNSDRHLFNIVFLQNTANGNYSLSPIFDCGAALLSDLEDFPLAMPVSVALRKVKAKPFSTSFSKQVKAVEPYLEENHVDTVSIDVSDLVDYYEEQHIRRALEVLQIGLSNAGISLQLENQGDQVTKTNVFR